MEATRRSPLPEQSGKPARQAPLVFLSMNGIPRYKTCGGAGLRLGELGGGRHARMTGGWA